MKTVCISCISYRPDTLKLFEHSLRSDSWKRDRVIPWCLGQSASLNINLVSTQQGQLRPRGNSMPHLMVCNRQISWTLTLVLGYLFYLLLGAMVFQLLEKQAEAQSRDQFQLEKLKFLENYTCLDRQALEQFVQVRGTICPDTGNPQSHKVMGWFGLKRVVYFYYEFVNWFNSVTLKNWLY